MKKCLVGLLGLILTMSLSSCLTKVGAAHEGVKVSLVGGGISEQNMITGWVWYNPITTQVYVYPMNVQTANYPQFTVYDVEGTEYIIDPMVSLYIKNGQSPRIVGKYLKPLDEIIELPLFNYTKEAFRIQFNSFKTEEVISKRVDLEASIADRLREKLNEEGFELDLLTPGIKFPDKIAGEIIQKNAAVQIAQRKQNELIAEQADADKKIVAATAERDANRLREQSLTPKILQQMWIEKWNGHVPTVQGGNSSGFILNLNDLK